MVCKVLCRIVGLPYVGKSSFFNVLTKTRCCYLSVNLTWVDSRCDKDKQT